MPYITNYWKRKHRRKTAVNKRNDELLHASVVKQTAAAHKAACSYYFLFFCMGNSGEKLSIMRKGKFW